MTTIRLVGGLAAFAAGMWLMIGIPIIDTGPTLVAGWVLSVAGIAVAAPAALDLIGIE